VILRIEIKLRKMYEAQFSRRLRKTANKPFRKILSCYFSRKHFVKIATFEGQLDISFATTLLASELLRIKFAEQNRKTLIRKYIDVSIIKFSRTFFYEILILILELNVKENYSCREIRYFLTDLNHCPTTFADTPLYDLQF